MPHLTAKSLLALKYYDKEIHKQSEISSTICRTIKKRQRNGFESTSKAEMRHLYRFWIFLQLLFYSSFKTCYSWKYEYSVEPTFEARESQFKWKNKQKKMWKNKARNKVFFVTNHFLSSLKSERNKNCLNLDFYHWYFLMRINEAKNELVER